MERTGVLLCLFLAVIASRMLASEPIAEQPRPLKDDLKALAAGRGWWELTSDDNQGATIKLFYLKARKEDVLGQLIVWGPGVSSTQSAFVFRLSEKERQRFITGEGAAFSGKKAQHVFSYIFDNGKLVLDGGVADNSTIGTVNLKGEWKWVPDTK